ncbi:MAG: hypothetical protein ACLFMQ_01625 [Desulfohalobiaceae bacterium]
MNRGFLIGISGKIGTGKTSMANEIVKAAGSLRNSTHNKVAFWDVICKRIAFGDLLKQELAERFPVDLEACYTSQGKQGLVRVPWGWRLKIWNSSWLSRLTLGSRVRLRVLLQWYGTQYRRKQDPMYWVGAMRQRLQQELNQGVCVVVDDVRFVDEKQLIEELGGIMVRIEPWEGWSPGPYAGHVSEIALDGPHNWDIVLRGPKLGNYPSLARKLVCIVAAKLDGGVDYALDQISLFDQSTILEPSAWRRAK